jgi:hypothetical protein
VNSIGSAGAVDAGLASVAFDLQQTAGSVTVSAASASAMKGVPGASAHAGLHFTGLCRSTTHLERKVRHRESLPSGAIVDALFQEDVPDLA